MDTGILETLGTLFGGLAIDAGGPRRRGPTPRQQIIEILYNSINEGSFGPLRLIEREDGLFVIGCGLIQRVDSIEDAESFVAGLLGKLSGVLGGLDPELSRQFFPVEEDEPLERPSPEEGTMFTEMFDPAEAEKTHWVEWTEPTETAYPQVPDAPAVSTAEPISPPQTAAIETEPAVATVEVPIEPAPKPPAAKKAVPAKKPARVKKVTPRKKPSLALRVDQVDDTLDEIVSHMRACCSAA